MKCLIDDCSGVAVKRGQCKAHYKETSELVQKGFTTWDEQVKGGEALALQKNCTIPNCNRPREGRGLCKAHYLQARRLVGQGKTTWQLLQESGQALPSRENIQPIVVPVGDTTTKGSV